MKIKNYAWYAFTLIAILLTQGCGSSTTANQQPVAGFVAPVVAHGTLDYAPTDALVTSLSDPSFPNSIPYSKLTGIHLVKSHYRFNTGASGFVGLDYDVQAVNCHGSIPRVKFSTHQPNGRKMMLGGSTHLAPATEYLLDVEVSPGRCDSFLLTFAVRE